MAAPRLDARHPRRHRVAVRRRTAPPLALAPSFGFALDLETFRQWTHRLDAVGLHDFYDAGPFVDYLPGYLYVAAMLQG
jgi:hypothetical protein